MDSTHQADAAPSMDDGLSHRVVYAVAEREGVEPESLDPPLYSALDPEALDRLWESDHDTSLSLSFRYLGYQIEIEADGTIAVEE